jgi:integrase
LAIIRLLLLSGARKTEIEGLRWDEIDAERGLIRKAHSKTGPKVMMLSEPMRAIIEAQPRLSESPWVFPGRSGKGHYVGTPRIWKKVRERAKVEDVRLHDLRHSAASFALASGLSLELIGGLLGHAQPRTTARYAHLAADDLHRASDKTAKAIGDLLGV